MGISAVVVPLGLVVATLVALSTVGIVGLTRIHATVDSFRARARDRLPVLLFLGVTVGVSAVVRRVGTRLSWLVGWNVTGTIFTIEGTLVATVQSVANPWLTRYFAAVYVVGYAYLLVFPLVAYSCLDDGRPLRVLAVAYAINYVLGVVGYLLFIAYGPRNLMPDLVDSLLYARYPQLQLVTSAVNTNTNVFPSLHASLSVTVATVSWWTRDRYPRWPVIALPLAASVLVSTVYLGIHWVTDVIVGTLLALGAVAVANRVTGEPGGT